MQSYFKNKIKDDVDLQCHTGYKEIENSSGNIEVLNNIVRQN